MEKRLKLPVYMLLALFTGLVLVGFGIKAEAADISVTYHRVITTDTVTMSYNYGDRITGNDTNGAWATAPWWEADGSGFSSKRFVAWNTALDYSGTWYRGNQVLTPADGTHLDLYERWVSAFDILPNFGAINPVISINGESNHTSLSDAYVVDKSQSLFYKSELNFESARDSLVTLWGRVDRVRGSEGTLKAKFDKRLAFEQDVPVIFTSTWLKPDRDDAVLTDKGWLFNISKDEVINSDYVVNIPIKMIDNSEFANLSYEDFMKPMSLTVANNYDLGVNAIISLASFNQIATSDKPVIEVGGEVGITINYALTGGVVVPISLNKSAQSQLAKLYPTGKVKVNYLDMATNLPVLPTSERFGRSKSAYYPVDDPNNYSDHYQIDIPEIPGYQYISVKDNQSLAGDFSYQTTPEITLLYVKIMPAKLIVKYVDEAGKDLLPSETQDLMIGDLYQTNEKTISGYSLKTKPTNASGTVTSETTEVVYVYTLNPKEVEPSKDTPSDIQKDSNDTALPTTGEKRTAKFVSVLGILAILIVLIYVIRIKKRNDKK